MKAEDIKKYMNKRVRFRDDKNALNTHYILSGCILRLDEKNGFFYQAELQDLKSNRSILICRLEDVLTESEV